MINITVAGVAYEVPSSAADTNWATKQVAFEQAVATETTSLRSAVTPLQASVTALQTVTWEALSHENTWTDLDTPLAATIDPAGWVTIRGDVGSGSEPLLCNLPSGYEPNYDQWFVVPAGASMDKLALVRVRTDGKVFLAPSVGTSESDVYDATYLNVRFSVH